MTYSQHYNWYQLKNVLCEAFSCNVKWDQIDILIFERENKKIIFSKNNNMSVDFVEEILKKLDITLKEFQEGYDMVFHT